MSDDLLTYRDVAHALTDAVVDCPLGYHDGRPIWHRATTDADVVAWLQRLARISEAVKGIDAREAASEPPGPPPNYTNCQTCGTPLMYSARQRGDSLCGPRHRKATGTQGLADRCRAAGIEPSLVLEILASPECRAAIRLAIRDAEFFDAIPDDALRPGHTWRDPEGTEYVVVPAGDVGDRPRWLVGERTTPHHLSGLRTRGDLHMKTPVYHPYVLVEKRPSTATPHPVDDAVSTVPPGSVGIAPRLSDAARERSKP